MFDLFNMFAVFALLPVKVLTNVVAVFSYPTNKANILTETLPQDFYIASLILQIDYIYAITHLAVCQDFKPNFDSKTPRTNLCSGCEYFAESYSSSSKEIDFSKSKTKSLSFKNLSKPLSFLILLA